MYQEHLIQKRTPWLQADAKAYSKFQQLLKGVTDADLSPTVRELWEQLAPPDRCHEDITAEYLYQQCICSTSSSDHRTEALQGLRHVAELFIKCSRPDIAVRVLATALDLEWLAHFPNQYHRDLFGHRRFLLDRMPPDIYNDLVLFGIAASTCLVFGDFLDHCRIGRTRAEKYFLQLESGTPFNCSDACGFLGRYGALGDLPLLEEFNRRAGEHWIERYTGSAKHRIGVRAALIAIRTCEPDLLLDIPLSDPAQVYALEVLVNSSGVGERFMQINVTSSLFTPDSNPLARLSFRPAHMIGTKGDQVELGFQWLPAFFREHVAAYAAADALVKAGYVILSPRNALQRPSYLLSAKGVSLLRTCIEQLPHIEFRRQQDTDQNRL